MRDYPHYCPIAHALSVVGERWSLLVVRELQHGPRRYTDLLEGMPGCSTNMLASRLRELEAAGIVAKRTLPPPLAAAVYELTESGVALRPVLHELALWGARTLGPPGPDAVFVAGWLERALRTVVGPSRTAAAVTFAIGGDSATVASGEVVPGCVDAPDAVVRGDPAGFYHLMVEGSIAGVEIVGDGRAVEALFPQRVRPATAIG